MLNVTIWNEFIHEQNNEQVRSIYPRGIHEAIAENLHHAAAQTNAPPLQIQTATLQQPEHGLPAEILDQTDVLFWWGHTAHHEVHDELVDRIQQRVLAGMGFIALHSAHDSKPFKRLMGTNCQLQWREAGEQERLWIVDPSHPIVSGLDAESILVPQAEMYGEPFGIPHPDELIMISWFAGGEVFRSACTFKRGNGKIFYFRPGHETYPIYHDPQVTRILLNAANWAAPSGTHYELQCRHAENPAN